MARTYTPAEIVYMLEARQDAARIAIVVEAFWSTIRAALMAYDQKPVAPRACGT